MQFSLLQVLIATFSICSTLIWFDWVTGSRFTKVETDIDWLKNSMRKIDEISRDVNELRVNAENKKTSFFAAQSPVRLTENGQKLLTESGLKDYIDRRKDLLDNCASSELPNAYEVQQYAFDLFDNINFEGEFDPIIKQYTFEHGISLDIVKRIGALYFRDLCLERKGMKDIDVDKYKPVVE